MAYRRIHISNTLISLQYINGQNFVNEEDSRVMQALPREGLYLMHKEYLSAIEFYFFGIIKDDVDLGAITSLMEDLRPHSNLKELYVFRYGGVRMPWINHLPNLVNLDLDSCENLEYTGSSSGAPLQLPCLSRLRIVHCPKLACTVMCPSLEELNLNTFNEGMRILMASTSLSSGSSNPQHSASSSDILVPKLKKMEINNVAWLESLHMESLQCLETLHVDWDDKLVHLPNCIQYLPALQSLLIDGCKELAALPHWIPELTSLKSLVIWASSEILEERCRKDPPGEDWPYIKHIADVRIS